MLSDILDDQQLPRDFAVYQRFNRLEDMNDVVATLEANHIIVRTSHELAGEWKDTNFIGSPLQPKFWIEIPARQFAKANFMLREAAEENISDADLDAHPFAEYARAELEQVLLEDTEWSPDAVVVARKLLLRQGHDVDLSRLRQASRERVARKYTPRSGHRLALLFFTLYGGFSGLSVWITSLLIAAGVLLWYTVGTRRDPNGVSHPAYDKPSRQWGRVGLLVTGVCLAFGLLNFFWLHWVRFPAIDVWYWIWF